MTKTKSTDGIDFEDKLGELEALIEQIESGREGLNSAVDKYANAQKIAGELEKILDGARKQLEKVKEVDEEEE